MARLEVCWSLVVLPVLAGMAAAQQLATAPAIAHWTPSVVLAQGSYSVNDYKYDDGTSENSLGVTQCGPPNNVVVCWVHVFDANGGADTITSVASAWGSPTFPGASPPAGSPTNVGVWADPNQDGNPGDATLLVSVATTIENPDTDILQIVAIPPTAVAGKFFVGAYCVSACSTPTLSQYPAPMDTDQSSLGRAWICANTPASGFNANQLGSNSFPPIDIGTIPGFDTVWLLRAQGAGAPPVVYCTAKVNSLGCPPSIGAYGVPSASATSGFVLTCGRVLSHRRGLLVYGFNGPSSAPFFGGTLCVAQPVHHAVAVSSGGNPPPTDCSGVFVIDMSAFAHGHLGGAPDPALTTAGQPVWAQWWARDSGFPAPDNVELSAGITWTIGA